MILEGARGKCAKEIGNALRIEDIDHVEIRKQLNKLLKDLNVRQIIRIDLFNNFILVVDIEKKVKYHIFSRKILGIINSPLQMLFSYQIN